MADDKTAPAADAPATSAMNDDLKRRMTTVFGWVAGGSLGLLVNYGLFLFFGEGYPTTPTTFVTFLAGAFAGMHLADRLGARGFRPLGIAAGVLLVCFAWIVVAGLMSS